MQLHARRKGCGVAAAIAFSAVAFAGAHLALAQPTPTVVVPRVGIPAGTILTGDMVEERSTAVMSAHHRAPLTSVADVVGRIARQWLPPGQAISRHALRSIPILSTGAFVDIVFDAHGVMLTTRGLTVEPGGLGDTIRVRNVRSGVIVAGRVLGKAQVMVDAP